ncbi:uncharacterized protein [Salminus brasiliensis]|uniref:uncharacterized protein n=1 Tax=Salminus brasiliensis TaxID=930266 RepID=UPI003B838392
MMTLQRTGVIILILQNLCSAQSAGNSESLYLSIKPGEAATLRCPYEEHSSTSMRMWFKQRLEHSPLEVVSKLGTKDAIFSSQFNQSRFKDLNRNASSFSLTIENVTKQDEGMYFCGVGDEKTLKISNSTFLAVTGDIKISVDQTPVFQKIIIGNGTTECRTCHQPVLVLSLGLALGLSLFGNIIQACWSWRRGICSGKTSQSDLHDFQELLKDQDGDEEEFYFAALHFSDKMKRRGFKENVFTKVRFTPFSDHKPAQ